MNKLGFYHLKIKFIFQKNRWDDDITQRINAKI
jgi:hypothetical protein